MRALLQKVFTGGPVNFVFFCLLFFSEDAEGVDIAAPLVKLCETADDFFIAARVVDAFLDSSASLACGGIAIAVEAALPFSACCF